MSGDAAYSGAADGRQGLIAWFIQNPVAANLLMLFIILAGSITAVTLRKEFIPEIATGVIQITMEYPGASPESVDEGVCVKVEEALSGIDDIKRIEASAYEGVALIRVTLENDADVDVVLNTVRSRIDGIDTFPELVKKPLLVKETIREGVLWIILSADMDEGQIKTLAQQLKDELLNRTRVRQAEIQGTRDNEIAIEVSEARLRQYGLSLESVGQAVQRSSLDLPGGAVKTAAGEILVRTTGQVRDGRRFADIVVRSDTDGQRVTLGDVADIDDGFEEANWFLTYQGEPAVGIQVFRVGDQSTLEVAAAARDFVQQRRQTLPKGASLSIIGDTSIMLKDRLTLMLKNLLSGAALVFAALIVFLQARVAFWVMAGIPVSFLGAVWLMPTPLIDSSINMITLFGCILVIGILVDDAIVIGENIHTTVQRHGPGMDVVIRGARQVAMPATFGVLTTMAAFIPMLMIPGMNGKLWRGIALVVIACLFFSLVESKWILPSHLAHARLLPGRRKTANPLIYLQDRADAGLRWSVERLYRPVAHYLFERRYATLAVFIGLMLMAATALQTGRVRMVFFPDIEEDIVEIQLSMAAGTPAGEIREATRRIEAAAGAVNDAVRKESGIEEDTIRNMVAFSSEETHVWIYAELMPSERRDIGAVEIIRRWREQVGEIAGAVSLDFSGTAADSGEAVDFELYSRNVDHLKAAAQEIKKRLSTYPGLFDIKDSAPRGKAEIKLVLKPMAGNLGVTTSDLAIQVRQAFYGLEVQTFQRGRNEVKVMVRYPKDERRSLYSLHNMTIRTETGVAVRLDDVADVLRTTSPAVVERFNGRRVLHVTASVDKNLQEPGKVIGEMTAECLPGLMQQYPGLQFDLGGEAREQRETLSAMGRGGVLALFAIYALMAVPLRSYLQPMIIMSAIPFGIVGAVAGHWLMGLPVSILSLCGMVALSGVVVNDSLVMVSFINEQRDAGKDYAHAVREAGAARFRAIMLTSLTTFCGLFPMMMERSIQAQHLIPMAVSLAFGILFATVITLILVPVIYLAGLDVSGWFKRRESAVRTPQASRDGRQEA